jgi:hypothetical protein
MFSSSFSVFVWSIKSSIFIHESYNSIVSLSFNCFRGFGLHLWFHTNEEALIVLNVNNLCFPTFQSDAILGSFPRTTDNFNPYYNVNHYKGLHSNENAGTGQQTSFHSRSENTVS